MNLIPGKLYTNIPIVAPNRQEIYYFETETLKRTRLLKSNSVLFYLKYCKLDEGNYYSFLYKGECIYIHWSWSQQLQKLDISV